MLTTKTFPVAHPITWVFPSNQLSSSYLFVSCLRPLLILTIVFNSHTLPVFLRPVDISTDVGLILPQLSIVHYLLCSQLLAPLQCTCLPSSLTSLVQTLTSHLIQGISLFHLPLSILSSLIFFPTSFCFPGLFRLSVCTTHRMPLLLIRP